MFFMIVMIELIVMIVKGERGRGERQLLVYEIL